MRLSFLPVPALAAVLLAAPALAETIMPNCPVFNPNTQVGPLKLADEASSTATFGKSAALYSAENGADTAWRGILTADGKQILEVRHHPGDLKLSFREIQVRQAKGEVLEQKLAVSGLATDTDIKLGVTRDEVIKTHGPCFSTSKKGRVEIIRYDETRADSTLLKKYNMPSYYTEYEFQDGKLARFAFGFEQP